MALALSGVVLHVGLGRGHGGGWVVLGSGVVLRLVELGSGSGYGGPAADMLLSATVYLVSLVVYSLPSITCPEYSLRMRSASTSFPTSTIAVPVKVWYWS